MTDLENIRLRPLGNVVLVLPKAPEIPRSGSIVLADVQHVPETCGLVIRIGDGFQCGMCKEPLSSPVQVGEWVLFSRSAGTEVPLDGRTFLLLEESEILAVIDEPVSAEVLV